MAVGLRAPNSLLKVSGIKIGTAQAGIKYQNRADLTLIEICENSSVAAVFTRNAFCAAPVIIAKKHLTEGAPSYLVINSGNANAGTGELGLSHAKETCQALADLESCSPQAVLPFSTGVIGEPLKIDKLTKSLPKAIGQLAEDNWLSAANAIMTTDTIAKGFSKQFEINGTSFVITGITKGAGMICPDMATLLSFIATDAKVEATLLNKLLKEVVADSFNSITVDSDTSTNDSCVLMATGKSQLVLDENTDITIVSQFKTCLDEVFQALAQSIIRDAEGATKFITIKVQGGRTKQECKAVAYTVAHSPLVKTAFFASDPNWGRILAAVGRAGVENLDVSLISMYLNDVCIVSDGARAESYKEEDGQTVMNESEIVLTINLDRGDESQTLWTSDLSHEYVKINAEYRT